jgi:hypothetical protein
MVTKIVEYVDHSPEHGFFGKVVATSDVTGMTDRERASEVAEMRELLGYFVLPREVETVGAA